jgi:ABC-type anion transport system duplicated permease subunit
MKLSEIKDKSVCIKCATIDEMESVVKILDVYVPWAFRGGLNNMVNAFDNEYVFIHISQSGEFTNQNGQNLISIPIKILATEFLNDNQF